MNSSAASWWQVLGVLALETSVVVLAAALAQARLKSAFWRRTAWQACALCLVLLVLVELSGASHKLVQWSHARPAETAAIPAAVETIKPAEPITPAPAITPTILTEIASPSSITPVINPAAVKPSAHEPPIAGAWLGIVWLMGTCGWLLRSVSARWALWRFRSRHGVTLRPSLYDRVQSMARRLGMRRSVAVLEASELTSPIVFGMWFPAIVLPARFDERFTVTQQEAMLAHELAHLAAFDPLWYWLTDLAVACLWWQPLVWWARGRLHAASEVAADEASVLVQDGPAALAECLVAIGKELTQTCPPESIGIEGSQFRSRLGLRVEQLLTLENAVWQQPGRVKTWLAKAILPLLLLAVLLPGLAKLLPNYFLGNETALSLWQRSWHNLRAAAPAPDAKGGATRLPSASGAAPASETQTNSMQSRLDRMVLTELYSDRLPLGEVTKFLNEKSKKLGGNFTFVIDTKKGEEAPAITVIELNPALQRITMEQALQAIVRGSEDPIHYEFAGDEVHFKSGPGKGMERSPLANKNRDAMWRRLDDWHFPLIQFPRMPLSEVVRFFGNEVSKQRPKGEPVNVLIQRGRDDGIGGPDATPNRPPAPLLNLEIAVIRLKKPLKNGSLHQVLEAVCNNSDLPLDFVVEDYAVIFVPKKKPLTLAPKRTSAFIESSAAATNSQTQSARTDELAANREPLPANRYFRVDTTQLTDAQKREREFKFQTIHKLESLIFPEIGFKKVPLEEAVKFLSAESRRLDPEKKGVYVLLDVNPGGEPLPADGRNVKTGESPAHKIEPGKISVVIDPPLQNASLGGVLDALSRVTESSTPGYRLKYEIKNYGIVLAFRGLEAEKVVTRTFKVDPDAFNKGLASIKSIPSGNPSVVDQVKGSSDREVDRLTAGDEIGPVRTNQILQVKDLIRGDFQNAGVNFQTNAANGTGTRIFFNDHTGVLLVRATLADLEIIQAAIDVINMAPPQLNFDMKVVEITAAGARALNLDWFGRVDSTGKNRPSSNILSMQQYAAIVASFGKNADVSLLSAPRTLTLSGSQTRISDPGADNQFVVDVIPTVKADGFTVELTSLIKLPLDSVPQVKSNPDYSVDARGFIVMHNLVRDGQTMVLGGFIQPKTSGKKMLMFLITPAMVDRAGNAVHTKEERAALPKAPSAK